MEHDITEQISKFLTEEVTQWVNEDDCPYLAQKLIEFLDRIGYGVAKK